jgi:hypothetical protein
MGRHMHWLPQPSLLCRLPVLDVDPRPGHPADLLHRFRRGLPPDGERLALCLDGQGHSHLHWPHRPLSRQFLHLPSDRAESKEHCLQRGHQTPLEWPQEEQEVYENIQEGGGMLQTVGLCPLWQCRPGPGRKQTQEICTARGDIL